MIPRRITTILAGLMATVAVFGIAGLVPAGAAAAETGSIAGRLSSQHAPIVRGTVTALTAATGARVAAAQTNEQGEYVITALPPGEYILSMTAHRNANALSRYYPDATTHTAATPVSVNAGQTTSGINAELPAGGEITGTVTISGQARQHLILCAINPYTGEAAGPPGSYVRWCAQTNEQGEYRIARLETAAWTVVVHAPSSKWAATYAGNATKFGSATILSVTAGQTTTGVNIELQSAGQISGTVTGAGQPMPDGTACATSSAPKPVLVSRRHCSVVTAGHYMIAGLATGEYDVEIMPGYETECETCELRNLITEHVPGVQVSAGQTTSGINAELPAGGQITGAIDVALNAADYPLPGGEACAYAANESETAGRSVSCARANTQGEYNIRWLPTGEYKVRLTPPHHCCETQAFSAAWYQSSTAIAVTEGETTAIGPVVLPRASNITGTLAAGFAARRVCAHATGDPAGLTSCVEETGTTFDFGDIGLPAGTYTVGATAERECTWGECHAANELGLATVSVAADTTSETSISAVRGGEITGTITDGNTEQPMENAAVCAWAYGWVGREGPYDQCGTVAEGHYTIAGLATGEYTVEVTPQLPNYAAQKYRSTVVITAGHTTGGIDWALPELDPAAPEVTAAPTIMGLAEADRTVSCAGARWRGARELRTSTEWQLDGHDIAQGRTYTIGSAAAGQTLRCISRAANAAGTATAASTPVRVAAAQQHPPRPRPPGGRNTQPTQPSDSGHAHHVHATPKRHATAGPAGGPGHDRERLRGRRIRVIVRCRRGGQACVARVIVGISARRCRGRHDRRCRIHEHLWRGRIHIAAGAARTISARLPRWLARRVHPGHRVIVHVHGPGIHNTRFDLVRQYRRGRRRGGTR